MGLRMGNNANTNTVELGNNNSIVEVKEINIEEEKKAVELKYKNSPEIDRIVESIDVYNIDSLQKFGQEPAMELAKFADSVLSNVESTKVEDSSSILKDLQKIMENFNKKDFSKKPGLFEKMFSDAKSQINKIIKKYHSMGDDVDKITTTLMTYQADIQKSNDELETMFTENVKYYEELTKYILAGEAAIEELKTSIIPEMMSKYESTQNQMDKMDADHMQQVAQALEQRVYDLRLSQTVALQTMPSLRMIQIGNFNLMRKINSAFIVTLPVFKNCLIQALHLKRQSLQSEALAALDKTTNDMILRNAQNTANQSIITANQANSPSVNLETLEQAWSEIMRGVTETQRIQSESSAKRAEGTKQLASLNERIKNLKN